MAKTTLSTEERPVHVDAGRVTLEGDLSVPPHARAVVLFAHGSGSSRFSSRNKRVAVAQLTAPARLAVVPGATHLFEEPGALDEVARHAAAWIESYAAVAT